MSQNYVMHGQSVGLLVPSSCGSSVGADLNHLIPAGLLCISNTDLGGKQAAHSQCHEGLVIFWRRKLGSIVGVWAATILPLRGR